MRKLIVPLFLVALAFVACASEEGRFTIATTKDVDLARVDFGHLSNRQESTGHDGRYWFLFIPLGRDPTIDRAMDKCLEAGKGDVVLNGRVKVDGWSLLFVSHEEYVVEGDVASFVASSSTPEQPPSGALRDVPRDGVLTAR